VIRRCLTLILLAVALVSSHPASATDRLCADPVEIAFLQGINDYRAAHGVAPLVISRSLSWAAAHHAEYMAATDDVDHTLADGIDWFANIRAYGYPGYWIGENVLGGERRSSSAAALELFTTSPSHNANMLDPTWQAIGIGREVNLDGKYKYYWATEFGSARHRTVTCP
jgi:uncharacterized protein YkwD